MDDDEIVQAEQLANHFVVVTETTVRFARR
jgi:hypothetical protein